MRRIHPIIKAAAVLTLCAGIAFAGLVASGPLRKATARKKTDPMKGYYPLDMPRYPGAKEYPLTRDMKVGQSGLRMSYFYTRDDPLKVANFYADRWLTRGFHVTRDITMGGGYVSALDTKANATRQVLIYTRGDVTAVFPSVHLNPVGRGKILGAGSGEGDAPPTFPGSEGVMTFGAKDTGHLNKITVFLNHGGLEANLEFYKVEMAARGWKLDSHADKVPGSDRGHHVLMFKKDGREATVNLMRIGKSNQVRVHITQVGPR